MRVSLLIFWLIVTSSCARTPNDIDGSPVDSVRAPILTVTGDVCPIFEQDLFKLPGKEIFNDCDLRDEPKLFDGKLVRIKARYGFMIHGRYLSSNACPGLSASVHDSISPTFESEIASDYIQNLKITPVDIIAVGRFT